MSRYPEIRAGQRITGEMLTGMQFQEVVKQSATSRSNTSTMTPDPDLQFEVEGSAIYVVEFFINYIAEDTPGFKASISVPAGASGLRRVQGLTPSVTGGIGDMRSGVEEFPTGVTYGKWTGGKQAWVEENVTVFTSSAGTVAYSWAQNNPNGTATQVAATSYARMKRIQ